jgi:mannitol-specific phosphotransferase system IIBC component
MTVRQAADVKLVVFACEAGMGSSLIGANQLKKRVKDAGLAVKVIHSPVNQIPSDADVVLAHEGLAARARAAAPGAVILPFKQFLNNPASELLVRRLQAGEPISDEAAQA